jgi:hypothetical protein
VCNPAASIPTVNAYDTRFAFSTGSGLDESIVCKPFQVLTKLRPNNQAVTNINCTTSGFNVTLVFTTSNGTVNCNFAVNVQSSCPTGTVSTAPTGKSGHKKAVDAVTATTNDPNGPCFQRTNVTTCMVNCVVNSASATETLSQCPCIWNPPGSTISMGQLNPSTPPVATVCPDNQVCCYDQPCQVNNGNQTACIVGGGGTPDSPTTSNCVFSNNMCTCAPGLVATNFELMGGINALNTNLSISAPFDCACNNTGLVAENGKCVQPGASTMGTGSPSGNTADAATVAAVAIALVAEVQVLAELVYTTSCKPCVVSVSSRTGADVTHICTALRETGPCAVSYNGPSCTLTVPVYTCSALIKTANDMILSDPDVIISYDVVDAQSSAANVGVLVLAYAAFALLAMLL